MSWRTIGVLAVLCAALVAAYLLQAPPQSGPVIGVGGIPLFPDADLNDVTALAAEIRAEGKPPVTLAAARDAKDRDRWAVDVTTDGRKIHDQGDRQSLEALARECLNLKSYRRLTADEAKEHLADYGLATPAARVTVTLAAGRTWTMELGAISPQDARVYARVEGDPAVHLVPKSARDHALHEGDHFRDPVVQPISPYETTAVELRMPSGVARLERAGDGWRQTLPVPDVANPDVVHPFLDRVHTRARARRFLDPPAGGGGIDRTPLGLAAPFLELALTDKQGTVHRFSYGEGAGTWEGREIRTAYAFRHADGRIFEVGSDQLPNLKIDDTSYFRAKQLLGRPAEEVARLTVAEPGAEPWEVSREHAWKVTKPGTFECDSFRTDELVKRLDELRAERFRDTLPPEGPAALGLDPGHATRLEIGWKDAARAPAVFWLGSQVGADPLAWVRRGDDGPVYAVPEPVRAFLTGRTGAVRPPGKGYLAFVQRTLWTGLYSADVQGLEVQARKPDGTLAIGRWARESGQPWSAQDATTPAVPGAVLDDRVSDLCALRVARWLDRDPADLAVYGLATEGDAAACFTARIAIRVKRSETEEITRTLYVGREGPEGFPVRAEKGHAALGDFVGSVDPAAGRRWRDVLLAPGGGGGSPTGTGSGGGTGGGGGGHDHDHDHDHGDDKPPEKPK